MPNANCVVTPVEVLETRYPLLHHEFSFNEGSGGAGRSRGGLGSVRRLELLAPTTFSCYHSSERLYPWGLFEGGEGSLSSFTVRVPGDESYQNFKERFGVRCAGKFTNVHLPEGAMLELKVGGGGGYGPAAEREPSMIARDLVQGLYEEDDVARAYPAQLAAALRLRDELLAALRSSTRAGEAAT